MCVTPPQVEGSGRTLRTELSLWGGLLRQWRGGAEEQLPARAAGGGPAARAVAAAGCHDGGMWLRCGLTRSTAGGLMFYSIIELFYRFPIVVELMAVLGYDSTFTQVYVFRYNLSLCSSYILHSLCIHI